VLAPQWLRVALEEVGYATVMGIPMPEKAGRHFNRWRDYYWWSLIIRSRTKQLRWKAQAIKTARLQLEREGHYATAKQLTLSWERHQKFIKQLDPERRVLFSTPIGNDSDIVDLNWKLRWLN
jgi:hypothetical protein